MASQEPALFLYMATTLNHGPGPRYKKYTGNPLATPAGLLEQPLSVQPDRKTIPERIAEAGLSGEPTACDVLWLDDGIGAVLQKLKKMGELDNTIVFLFDDHGVESGKGSSIRGRHSVGKPGLVPNSLQRWPAFEKSTFRISISHQQLWICAMFQNRNDIRSMATSFVNILNGDD